MKVLVPLILSALILLVCAKQLFAKNKDAKNKVCNLPKEKGVCRASKRKYFYNAKTEECEQFIYGGCKGNANRFDNKIECEVACWKKFF